MHFQTLGQIQAKIQRITSEVLLKSLQKFFVDKARSGRMRSICEGKRGSYVSI